MAQLMNVRLSRVDAQPWGLRLQGGKDFGTPLLVQKVSTIYHVCKRSFKSYCHSLTTIWNRKYHTSN